MKNGGFIWVFFDGEDWGHRWGPNQYLFHPKPSKTPIKDTECNHSLFTYGYTPKSGDVVVDIGAGVGTEVGLFSNLVGSNGKVISIEPDPTAYRCLNKTVNLLSHRNVITINAGASNSAGIGFLSQEEEGSISNGLIGLDTPISIRVNTLTLDSIVKKYNLSRINYLKMNIEGAEIMALDGFKTHWNIVNNWCISCHDFLGSKLETHQLVSSWLLDKGYRLSTYPYAADHRPWEKFYIFASRA